MPVLFITRLYMSLLRYSLPFCLLWASFPAQAESSKATEKTSLQEATTPPRLRTSARSLTPSEIYSEVQDSVVLIKCDESTGAGFLVKDRRTIATAFHVVSAGADIEVLTHGGKSVKARLLDYDKRNDLALLEVEQELSEGNPLPLRLVDELQIGEPVVVIGHPFGSLSEQKDDLKGLLTWTMTAGVVGATSPGVLQTDAAINPGNSGGPVLDYEGKVLGVVSAQLRDASNVGFAVRSDLLKKLIDRPLKAPALIRPPFRRLGLGLLRSTTVNELWTTGLTANFERRSWGSGLRRSLWVGYAWVNEMPESGGLFNYKEEFIFAQADLGYHIAPLHLDVLAGVTAGYFVSESIRAQAALEDASCNPSSGLCELDVTFLTSRTNRFRADALAGIKFPELLGGLDLGAGVFLDVIGETGPQFRIWVEAMDKQ
ncbi:MAG: S1C family serine protease [Myxococcota bacterium]